MNFISIYIMNMYLGLIRSMEARVRMVPLLDAMDNQHIRILILDMVHPTALVQPFLPQAARAL